MGPEGPAAENAYSVRLSFPTRVTDTHRNGAEVRFHIRVWDPAAPIPHILRRLGTWMMESLRICQSSCRDIRFHDGEYVSIGLSGLVRGPSSCQPHTAKQGLTNYYPLLQNAALAHLSGRNAESR